MNTIGGESWNWSPNTGTTTGTNILFPIVTNQIQISTVENGYIVINYNKQYVAASYQDLLNLLKTLLEVK